MNPLQRALIEKAGHDHGFEYVIVSGQGDSVQLASARHRAQVRVLPRMEEFELNFSSTASTPLVPELARSFPDATRRGPAFVAAGQDELVRFLRRAAALARSLPNQAAVDFESMVKKELAAFPVELIRGTEVERVVRQRVGQQTFRQAMMAYWGGACAVTEIAIPEVLRASHAKPWAECASDTERLDVFNGFLLSANLDALFDRFLISFDVDGGLMIASSIPDSARARLGLIGSLRLRWLAPEHSGYLQFHRARFLENSTAAASEY